MRSTGKRVMKDNMEKPTRVLWTDKPLVIDYDTATRPCDEEELWEQAVYPIGNGRLGCTAFGEPKRERIQFNQDSLWVGNEDSTGGYQPFGDLYVEMPHETFSDYRRELDIERAVQTITYQSGGVNFKRESFASHPAQLIALRFTADQPGALTGTVSMGNVHEIPILAEDDTLVMKGDTSKFWWWGVHLKEPKRLIASREYTSEQNIDLEFEARVRVLHEGGAVSAEGGQLVFADCDSLTLLLAADTNYVADRQQGWRGEHPHARVAGYIAAAESRSFDALLGEHIADYQGLFNRMSLDLGDTPRELSDSRTSERVKAYAAQIARGGDPEDRDLEALLYQYARYLMISSSRPGHGALPANLQGIWLINKRPSWRCDFHTDINIQMNYWFTSASNLADCFEPFAHWVDSIREVRKAETQTVLGVKRGWLMRSENGIFGGSTWHFQKGDSAWLCQNLWDHYTFTQDKAYLARYAYPVMKEISEFWIDHLKALPDGTLVAPDGRSPEHGPVGVDGVTYDQQLCWDLFNNTIEASAVLDEDAELRAELVDKRDRLLGPQIGRWGQLQEWMEDIDDPEDDHRHINHLIGVYPGRSIHPSTTPEFAEAAKVGLAARLEHGAGHPAWSRVWKACMFARLQDGESAYGQLAETLGTHIFENLWAVHPPFQIDANFGYAAAVNEMLAQSSEGGNSACPLIHLLPALPQAWPTGSVTGIRVRGGFEVDMEWQDGALVKATVRGVGGNPGRAKVCYGKGTAIVDLARDEACVLRASDFGLDKTHS
jgi:alpha-L-fucosidase 2